MRRRGAAYELIIIFLTIFLVGILMLGLSPVAQNMRQAWLNNMNTPDVEDIVLFAGQVWDVLIIFLIIGFVIWMVISIERREKYEGYY